MSTGVTINRGPLAAAILAILLGWCAGPGGQPTSSPEPTATPEATAEAGPATISWARAAPASPWSARSTTRRGA
jgi:hypothetical protein